LYIESYLYQDKVMGHGDPVVQR